MNSALPAGADTVSDVVQIPPGPNATAWDTVSFAYIGDRSCLKLRRWISGFNPTQPGIRTQKIAFVVLDYGAEAEISIHPAGMGCRTLDTTQYLPANLPYFVGLTDSIKATDPDSDGFTRWEEYRGFYTSENNHTRLDTGRAEIFYNIDDQAGCFPLNMIDYLSEMVGCEQPINISGADEDELTWAHMDIIGVRHFVDWESAEYNEGQWVANPLCRPSDYLGPYDWAGLWGIPTDSFEVAQQGKYSFITHVGESGSGGPTGATSIGKFTINGQHWIYPGGGGVYSINIYREEIWDEIEDMNLRRGLPVGWMWNPALPVDRERNVAHEFGHSLGLDHHLPCWTEGNQTCIITYWWIYDEDPGCQQPSYNPPPYDGPSWSQWFLLYADGYGLENDQWHCATRFRFRPFASEH